MPEQPLQPDPSHNYEAGLGGSIVEAWIRVFERQKAFAEHALEQLDDDGFFKAPAAGLNSPAVIVQHLAGNMLSRWTDFLTSDGEKPTRDRDAEFLPPEPTAPSRDRIMKEWQRGWAAVLNAVGTLRPEDLDRRITIRGAPHAVHAAVVRQIDHDAFHIGQLNIIARMHVGGDNWRWFTIPPGGSSEFTETVRDRHQDNG